MRILCKKTGYITLNGTMNYLKGKKGFRKGKKVRFKKKRYKVAKKCTFSIAAGSELYKLGKFKKYFKTHKAKNELQGYISITVKKKKVVDVRVSD